MFAKHAIILPMRVVSPNDTQVRVPGDLKGSKNFLSFSKRVNNIERRSRSWNEDIVEKISPH